MYQFREIYCKLLKAVADAHYLLDQLQLTAFFPKRGRLAPAEKSELMVVGRAVSRAQQKAPWLAVDVMDCNKREQIFDEAFNRSTSADTDECPMQWLTDAYGSRRTKNHYKARKSAFWNVTRAVAHSVGFTCDDWPSRLIWSDLYKISSFDGKNPIPCLKTVQLKSCKQLLMEEIALWKPKRILFLTGWHGWAEPFLTNSPDFAGHRRDGLVQWSTFPPEKTPSAVVCVHPQRKAKVHDVAQEIVGFLK
jgi:hypothetical protein